MRLMTPASAATWLLALSIAPGPPLSGQEVPDTLTVDDVVEAVRTANPSLAAARLAAAAATERIAPAGTLPDPMLSLGFMNRPVGDLGPGEPMTMNSVELMQSFPWPGTLRFARQRAEYLAEAGSWDAEEAAAGLISRAKLAYYELAVVDRSIDVMEETRALLRDFVEVSTARYAVGTGLQQDILQAQVAVAETTAELMMLAETRSAGQARLNALMGRATDAPVPALHLSPPGPELPPVDALAARAMDLRPAILGASERVRAAQSGVRVAERQTRPMLSVGVSYGQRPRFDDMASVMLGVSLPIRAGSRQVPERREMEAMLAMEQSREEDLLLETRATLTELRARAERARALYDLYHTSILPQAEASVESALSAYRVGGVDYMTLLSNQMTVNRFRIASLRLAADYRAAIAEMEALTGGEPGDES